MLRNVGEHGRAGDAFVPGAVDGGDAIPIMAFEPYRSITIRRGEQQVRRDELAWIAFLVAAIDAVAGEIGFRVDGPGEIDFDGAVNGRSDRGDDVLRRGSISPR